MKKYAIVLMTVSILLATWGFGAAADLAKEGEADYKAGMSATFKMLPMEKERLEMQFEVFGVVIEAPQDSLLYHATFYALGELHSIKGAYEESGFARYTRPDGDMIYMKYEATGKMGIERKLKGTFVGGTGKCTGITGGGEFTGLQGLKPPKEGFGMSITTGKINWKIP